MTTRKKTTTRKPARKTAAKKTTTRKPAAKKTATRKPAARKPAAKRALRNSAPEVRMCVRVNEDGSRTSYRAHGDSRPCPFGGMVNAPKKALVKGLKAAAGKKKTARKTPSVKKACRTIIRQEGVKLDGTLKKGYKFVKGGRVVKVAAAKKPARKPARKTARKA